jgi:hypothetical protein
MSLLSATSSSSEVSGGIPIIKTPNQCRLLQMSKKEGESEFQNAAQKSKT